VHPLLDEPTNLFVLSEGQRTPVARTEPPSFSLPRLGANGDWIAQPPNGRDQLRARGVEIWAEGIEREEGGALSGGSR